MTFNWFDVIVVLGIIQGLICALLVLQQKPRLMDTKLLGSILITFSLLSFKIELHTLGLWHTKVFRYFPLGIDLLIQPLLYTYVLSLTQQTFKFNKHSWQHFVPPLLFFAYSVFIYMITLQHGLLNEKDIIAEQWHYNTIKAFEDFLSVISAFIYGYLSFRSIKSYQKWVEENVSASNYNTYNWLKNLLLGTCILGLGLFLNIIIDYAIPTYHSFLAWQLFYIYLAILIYYLGIRGVASKQILTEPIGTLLPNQNKFDVNEIENAKIAITNALVDDHIFLQNDLTLQKLAKRTNLSPALVSVTINQTFNKSFRTLINDYRVEEVKIKLGDHQFSHLSILGIALECGFNSEASFYRIFKSSTGYSPKTYTSNKKQANI